MSFLSLFASSSSVYLTDWGNIHSTRGDPYRFGLEKSKTLMVGDRLDTDIKFGVQGGIDTLMVLTGVNKREDFEKDGAVAVPSFVIQSLGDLSILLSK